MHAMEQYLSNKDHPHVAQLSLRGGHREAVKGAFRELQMLDHMRRSPALTSKLPSPAPVDALDHLTRLVGGRFHERPCALICRHQLLEAVREHMASEAAPQPARTTSSGSWPPCRVV
ncbi:unnamed protein product [Vitrella brassicaformis CCMP3155]|uniref:Uncharacterized protein n=1 Tax=Vitrella brassicaformis (strain CCMP3155) TaxID=1169540 RepID=A0A0G4FUT1_VITBC|nr:unnamed protein product [Vitrella brassicaformis CCMP3155]|eukprot:CEM18710.1 unnamed protein product [Vitrella brassicaformis CCMP3155]